MEQRSDPSPKCSRCSIPILDSDLVLRDHGQLYHSQCARILNGTPLASGVRDEPPAVLCEICQTGIGSIAELAMTASGPTHVRCRPTDSR